MNVEDEAARGKFLRDAFNKHYTFGNERKFLNACVLSSININYVTAKTLKPPKDPEKKRTGRPRKIPIKSVSEEHSAAYAKPSANRRSQI